MFRYCSTASLLLVSMKQLCKMMGFFGFFEQNEKSKEALSVDADEKRHPASPGLAYRAIASLDIAA